MLQVFQMQICIATFHISIMVLLWPKQLLRPIWQRQRRLFVCFVHRFSSRFAYGKLSFMVASF